MNLSKVKISFHLGIWGPKTTFRQIEPKRVKIEHISGRLFKVLQFVFIVCQVDGWQNIFKLNCKTHFLHVFWKKEFPVLTLFRVGFFRAAHGWGGGLFGSLPKICHIYPTMMKLDIVIPYQSKIQKIWKLRGTSPEFCWHQHFFTRNQQILLHQEIQI